MLQSNDFCVSMAGHQNYMNIVGAFSLLGTASIVSLLYLYNVVDISSAANWEEEYISYSISRLENTPTIYHDSSSGLLHIATA